MELYVSKTGRGDLRPVTDEDRGELRKIGKGRVVRVKATRVRNPQFHAKFFALLRAGFANQDCYEQFEAFRREVTILSGFYNLHYHVDGSVDFVPASVAFHRMDEDEFERLFSAAIDVILQHFVSGMDDEQLRQAVEDEVVRFDG